jgi:hypothetical protein
MSTGVFVIASSGAALGATAGVLASINASVATTSTNVGLFVYRNIPTIGAAGRLMAEFLDESGSLQGANAGTGVLKSGTLQKAEQWIGGEFNFIGEKSGEERILEAGGELIENGKDLTINAAAYIKGLDNESAKGELSRAGLNDLINKFKTFAKENGFDKLTLNYTRSEGSSSKNPGSTMTFIFDFTQ